MKQIEIILADIHKFQEKKDKLSHIAPCYARKINEHKLPEDAKQELVTGILLNEYLGVYQDEQLKYNEQGKPFLTFGKNFFNVSHSGKYVALAIAECKVGIDIEKVIPCHEDTVNKVFNDSQKLKVEGLTGRERDEMFTKIWTECEAVLKLTGIGFSDGWKEEQLDCYHTQTIQLEDFFLTCATEEKFFISRHFYE